MQKITNFKINTNRIQLISSLKEEFKDLKISYLVNVADQLFVLEKNGVVTRDEVGDDVFYYILRLLRQNQILITGDYRESWVDEIEYNQPTEETEADIWYNSLSEKHQKFVIELIQKNSLIPQCK